LSRRTCAKADDPGTGVTAAGYSMPAAKFAFQSCYQMFAEYFSTKLLF